MMFTDVLFSDANVKEHICGKPLIMGYKKVGDPWVVNADDFIISKEEVRWEVDDEALHLRDERGSKTHLINGIEVCKGVKYFTGETYRVSSCGGQLRMLLYERKSLGDDFHIVISSHVDYETETLPRLIRSLHREGIPDEKITVVVAGSHRGSATMVKGYKRVAFEGNFMGCTGLAYMMGHHEIEENNILLLHDTCEADIGFKDKIENLDVGLPYEVISGHLEIGVWSRAFLERMKDIEGMNLNVISTYQVYNALIDMCVLAKNLGEGNFLRAKDVYGTGIKRQVMELPLLGIKKYLGGSMTGGRP